MLGVVSCSIIYQILLKSINWCKSQDGEVWMHVHVCVRSRACAHTHVHIHSHLHSHHGDIISLLGFFLQLRVGQHLK
jgi:hypothetical protein